MTYDEAVRALYSLGRELAAPQQARVQKFGLENISILAQELGQPERAVPCAHIAGTNGKGGPPHRPVHLATPRAHQRAHPHQRPKHFR
jgi:hypothetical protein